MSAKDNKPIHVSYKTIKEHLTKELEVSDQFISYLLKMLIKEGLIIRKRIDQSEVPVPAPKPLPYPAPQPDKSGLWEHAWQCRLPKQKSGGRWLMECLP